MSGKIGTEYEWPYNWLSRIARALRIYRECRKQWPDLWRRHALRISWRESND